jgi:hypothetical protein
MSQQQTQQQFLSSSSDSASSDEVQENFPPPPPPPSIIVVSSDSSSSEYSRWADCDVQWSDGSIHSVWIPSHHIAVDYEYTPPVPQELINEARAKAERCWKPAPKPEEMPIPPGVEHWD